MTLRVTELSPVLTTPMMVMGVEARLFAINVAVTILLVAFFKVWQWLAVTIILHFALSTVTRRDPYAREVYVKFLKMGSRYDPWLWRPLRRNARPSALANLCR